MILRKLLLVVFIGFLVLNSSYAQGSATWKTLAMVTKEPIYDESLGMYTDKISVSALPQAMQGNEITIDGYIIPLTGKTSQSHFMLSLYPANMCFFCGAAGPETAMQVFMSKEKKVDFTDNKITLKGVLRINEQNSSGLLYTLENAILL